MLKDREERREEEKQKCEIKRKEGEGEKKRINKALRLKDQVVFLANRLLEKSPFQMASTTYYTTYITCIKQSHS